MLSMALHMVGCACPTSFAKALFHPSHMLLVLDPPSRAMELTFHMGGGYIGGDCPSGELSSGELSSGELSEWGIVLDPGPRAPVTV